MFWIIFYLGQDYLGLKGRSRQAWVWLSIPWYTHSKVVTSHVIFFLNIKNIPLQKIKYVHALLQEILIIKESCNLVDESFLACNCESKFSQIRGLHRKTENYNVFHFGLLTAKINDKILWKVKIIPFLGPFSTFLLT